MRQFSIAKPGKPFACVLCNHEPWARRTSLEKHIGQHHPSFQRQYQTGLAEKIRELTSHHEAIQANPQHKPRPRLTHAEDDYYFSASAAFTTKAKEHNKSTPLLDSSSGEPETYLPHHIKTKNDKIEMGSPRQNMDIQVDAYPVDNSTAPLPDVPKEYQPFDFESANFNPWFPFQDGDDFKLAKWLIRNRISDTAITEFFNHGIHSNKSSFRSPHTLHNIIDSIDPVLNLKAWKVGRAYFAGDAKNCHQEYYYRVLEECIQNLMERPAFRDHLVYRPVKEYKIGSNGERKRVYSEIHTADWWHDEQVSTKKHSFYLYLFIIGQAQPNPCRRWKESFPHTTHIRI